jgi:hypothetical protein
LDIGVIHDGRATGGGELKELAENVDHFKIIPSEYLYL